MLKNNTFVFKKTHYFIGVLAAFLIEMVVLFVAGSI